MEPEPRPATASSAIAGGRRALCSIGHGSYEALLAMSAPTFARYAARHGYELVLRTDIGSDTRPAPWAKVPLILELLESHDLVLWIDADAIIVDDRDDLADEVRPGRWMYLSRMNTPEGLVPNTGVWMFTSCAESKAFLRAVDSRTAFTEHKWWENAAVIELLGYHFDPVRPGADNEFTVGVSYFDRAWNSIGVDPAPHPRIKHYAGLPYEERCRSLAEDVAALRRGTCSSSIAAETAGGFIPSHS